MERQHTNSTSPLAKHRRKSASHMRMKYFNKSSRLKVDFKAEESEIELPISVVSYKKQRCSRKTSTASLTTLKPLTV